MKLRSIQARLALVVGLGATLFWLASAALTADRVSREMRSLFDDDLRATAERLLPLAEREALGRAMGGHDGRVPRYHDDDDGPGVKHDDARGPLVWRVSDAQGRTVLHSEGAEEAIFPAPLAEGFSDTASHRIYVTTAQGLTIAVAAPLTSRAALERGLMLRLVLPLAVLLPLSLLGIAWAVRRGLMPLRALRQEVAARGAQDLSPLPAHDLPEELRPITEALNALLARLGAAFEAERSFASHAAHELRTPVAGAIAQIQRLRAETPAAGPRAAEIEATLKRLMRTSEKLMQLARAEGGRVTGAATDIRTAVRILAEDARRAGGDLRLSLPPAPVLTVMEPDALGIVLRNLVENALRHGTGPVDVRLGADLRLCVGNDGPLLSAETLARLGERFEKGEDSQGMGLGLAIVRTIADRAGAGLTFTARPGGGLEVAVTLPGAQTT